MIRSKREYRAPEPWKYEEHQVCKWCQQLLPLSEFHRLKKSKRTHRVTCKNCECDLICATCHRLKTWQRKAFIPEGSKRRVKDD
jgi:hypothetical protein